MGAEGGETINNRLRLQRLQKDRHVPRAAGGGCLIFGVDGNWGPDKLPALASRLGGRFPQETLPLTVAH